MNKNRRASDPERRDAPIPGIVPPDKPRRAADETRGADGTTTPPPRTEPAAT